MDKYPRSSNKIILLDDSLHNLHEAESVGIEGIHISQSGRTLEEGLAEALGHIVPPEQFAFSDVEYLLSKNKVDVNAINTSVWEKLAQQLALRMQQNDDGTLRIADLGAGVLSMLELIIVGGGEDDQKKPSLLSLVNESLESAKNNQKHHSFAKLEYFAYESNLNLLNSCKDRLSKMGFQEMQDEDGVFFGHITTEHATEIEVTIHLLPTNFQDEQHEHSQRLDLIIGCCFADLFDPGQLALSLQQFAHAGRPLVYLPITFAGPTQFNETYPVPSQNSNKQMIPSDTTAFRIYSESLTSHGHNLDPSLIVNAIRGYGGALIVEGSSNWIIDPSLDNYMWETMLYFFGMSGAREMTKHQLDAAGWISRCRLNPRTMVVSNVDLLFNLQADSHAGNVDQSEASDEESSDDHASTTTVSVQEIQFVAPYNVTTITKRWNTSDSYLAPDQVEIESLCSLISSGTELKIFKGSFESASLDVNIKDMADKSMEYPLTYGYSLVGRVEACGSNVDSALVGRLAFTFSPHSSRVIVDRDAIQLVPAGISPEDAIFFPSVETALNLVHDAHIRIGENVAVYGQGE